MFDTKFISNRSTMVTRERKPSVQTIKLKKKTLWPLFMDGVQLRQG